MNTPTSTAQAKAHVAAVQERRRSGAAGKHSQGTARQRTRGARKAAALADQRGW